MDFSFTNSPLSGPWPILAERKIPNSLSNFSNQWLINPGGLLSLNSVTATGKGTNRKIRLDSYLSPSTGLEPCSFLFLNKWLNQFSLVEFLVAASVKLGMLITHNQFWRQWNFITFVLFSLNGAICHKINLPLQSEKQLLWRLPFEISC